MNPREYRQMFEVEDFHWWYVALHELILAHVRRTRQDRDEPLKILDAGCGTGRLMELMQDYGKVSGFDLSMEALDCCHERGLKGVFRADLNSVSLRAGEYDVITSVDTLYHQWVVSESRVLESFFTALKPGGLLILNLVAHEFLRSSHDVAVLTRKRYTRQEVLELLKQCGFMIESATYRLGFLFFPIAVARVIRKAVYAAKLPESVPSDLTAPNPLLNRLLLWFARQENRWLLSGQMPIGTSIFLVARKPTA
ncbi:MAG: methyltransferase domain-containing protein [Geobacter sp.]|nr:methyltransferase domain-containing protein [Geobacter sp.]